MIRNGFFLLLFILAAAPIFSQPTISWGVELYPHWSNRRQAVYLDVPRRFVDSLDNLETGIIGYGAGLFWGVRGEKVGFQVGANYNITGYRVKRALLQDSSPDKPQYEEFSQVFRTHQIEVPIGLNFYQELGDQDEFYFMFGAALSYNIRNEVTTSLFGFNSSEERTEDAPGDFREFNIGFQAGLGWEHHFGEKLTMGIQPTFRFYFQGLLQDDISLPLNRNLYSLGLRVTFRLDQQIVYID